MTVEAREQASLQSLLTWAREKLRAAGVADPALDARLLVAAAADVSQVELATDVDQLPSETVPAKVRSMVRRRLEGESVHRILGYREFYGLRLNLSDATLEPRPDTETLVDLVLPEVKRRTVDNGECRILDLGTGTGAIALALLGQVPQATALGTDISDLALETAAGNARLSGLEERFGTKQSDWFSNVNGKFHIIVANPPYISSEAIESLAREVRCHDPLNALDGGKDGLDAYRSIAAAAKQHLEPEGHVAVEIGYDQKSAVEQLFAQNAYTLKGCRTDLAGKDRALLFAG